MIDTPAATTDDATQVSESATSSPALPTIAADNSAVSDGIRGRSAFYVEVTGAGLAVHTIFAAEDGRVLQMPAVFPDVHYALEQIDALRRLVAERFAQAAQVGAQVIAAQRAKAAADGQGAVAAGASATSATSAASATSAPVDAEPSKG
ncbi:MAG: hypothetical protein AD742_21275 [Methylibium sp. NZG]|nr:MAG: hypothetical protein AD742_21275 [Methylibium sp. NZG]